MQGGLGGCLPPKMKTICILMEIGDTSVQLPTLIEINAEINALVTSLVHKKLEEILTTIAEQEQIPRDRLFMNYLTSVDTIGKKPRKLIPDEIRCTAIIASGERCSKQQQKDNKFCGNHINAHRFGEYQPKPIQISIKNKIDST
jgi:hypothetical protein